MRYRAIPGRGTSLKPATVEGEAPYAMHFAEAFSAELGMPVLLVEAPEGGLVREVALVGGEGKRGRR